MVLTGKGPRRGTVRSARSALDRPHNPDRLRLAHSLRRSCANIGKRKPRSRAAAPRAAGIGEPDQECLQARPHRADGGPKRKVRLSPACELRASLKKMTRGATAPRAHLLSRK